MQKLTVVVPAFNESSGLLELHARLKPVLDRLDLTSDILFVDDGSSDDTWEIIRALHEKDPRVAGLKLSRNFGKEHAMTAGLDRTDADAVVVIDADLQDPPELIPKFIDAWRQGYDVVYGTRASRAGESRLKRFTAAAFYRVMERLSSTHVPRDTGDFRLMNRRAVAALGELRERQRFMKGLFAWVGFKQTSIVYERDARFAGTSKFNYWRLWNFAIEGITSFSGAPLKVATYIGVMTAMLSFLFGAFVLFKAIFFGDAVRGYPTLMLVILFLGGTQLIALGLIGEYLGRLYLEAKQRPLYLIDEYVASDSPKKEIE